MEETKHMHGRLMKMRKPAAVTASVAMLTTGGALLFAPGASAQTTSPTVSVTPSTVRVLEGGTSATPQTFSFTVMAPAAGDVEHLILGTQSTGGTFAPNTSNASAISYSGTPTVSVTSTAGSPVPVTASTQSAETGVTSPDELDLVFGQTEATGSSYTVSVSGVTIAAGAGAAANAAIGLNSVYNTDAAASPDVQVGTVSNATVSTTPVSLPQGSTNVAIPAISVKEALAGVLPAGQVTVTAPKGVTFASAPTVAVSSGNATVGPVTYSASATGSFSFPITAASTGSGATFTISGLTVNVGSGATAGSVVATLSDAPSAGDNAVTETLPLGYVETAGSNANTIAGPDSDSTASTIFNDRFGATGETTNLVLAVDDNFPDALSASYLAASLGTGILLTGTNQLPTVTASAIQQHSVSTVYVMGGPAAISDSVISQIQALRQNGNGGTQITVIRVTSGTDQFGTNLSANSLPASTGIGSLDLSKAFTNAATFDDVTGATGSTSGSNTASRTAILASGTNFPDAMAAATLSYADQLPIILTTPTTLSTEAAQEIQGLGIGQVILVGGPAAVSNSVEQQVADSTSSTTAPGLGVPVLRVAGNDQTDTAQLLAKLETSGDITGGATFASPGTQSTTESPAIFVARGDFYTDALTAASLLAGGGTAPPSGTMNVAEPLLLTLTPTISGQYLAGYLQAAGAGVGGSGGDGATTIDQFGGQQAITSSLYAELQSYLAGGQYTAGQ
jgi:putative cell wall-binding protein